MHAVKKESSTTTKIRAGSAKSSSNISLNDILLVGPTVHSSLIDILLRFRLHRITRTADMSKMYQAVELVDSDWHLHRFVHLIYLPLSFNDGICANTSLVISGGGGLLSTSPSSADMLNGTTHHEAVKLEILCFCKKTTLYWQSGPWDTLFTPTQEKTDSYALSQSKRLMEHTSVW